MTAAKKRPVSKLDKAVQTINKRERRALDLFLGRWNRLVLTVAACKHLHVTGKDSNGLEVWGEEKDKFDIYLQQNRCLVSRPEEIFREGIYFACYWWDGVGLLTGDQIGSFIKLLDDLAEMQRPKAQQGGQGVGQKSWIRSPCTQPTRAKQGPTQCILTKCTECDDSEMFEDIQDGNLVCRECGLCERLLTSEDFNWANVDWQGSSLVQKSQHQPSRYFQDLLRKFDISERLVPKLNSH